MNYFIAFFLCNWPLAIKRKPNRACSVGLLSFTVEVVLGLLLFIPHLLELRVPAIYRHAHAYY